jgi:hypothetical protein
VVNLLARGRESGVSVLLATQELADLDRAAPGLREQVVGVTAVKIAHRQEVPASARMIAQMVGTEKVWERTYQLGHPLLGGPTSRGTRRQVEQFVIHPNEIMSLPTGEALMLTKMPVATARIVQIDPPSKRGARPYSGLQSAPAPGAPIRDAPATRALRSDETRSPARGHLRAGGSSEAERGRGARREGPDLGR